MFRSGNPNGGGNKKKGKRNKSHSKHRDQNSHHNDNHRHRHAHGNGNSNGNGNGGNGNGGFGSSHHKDHTNNNKHHHSNNDKHKKGKGKSRHVDQVTFSIDTHGGHGKRSRSTDNPSHDSSSSYSSSDQSIEYTKGQHSSSKGRDIWQCHLDKNDRDINSNILYWYARGLKAERIAWELFEKRKDVVGQNYTFDSLKHYVLSFLLGLDLIDIYENEDHLLERPIAKEIVRLAHAKKGPNQTFQELGRNFTLRGKKYALKHFNQRLAWYRLLRFSTNCPPWQYQEWTNKKAVNKPGESLEDLEDENAFDDDDEMMGDNPVAENRNKHETPAYLYTAPRHPQMHGFGGMGDYGSGIGEQPAPKDQTYGHHQALNGGKGQVRFAKQKQCGCLSDCQCNSFAAAYNAKRTAPVFGAPTHVLQPPLPQHQQQQQQQPFAPTKGALPNQVPLQEAWASAAVRNMSEGRNDGQHGLHAHSTGGRWAFNPINPRYGIFEQHDYLLDKHELIDDAGDVIMRNAEPVWMNDHTADNSYQRMANGEDLVQKIKDASKMADAKNCGFCCCCSCVDDPDRDAEGTRKRGGNGKARKPSGCGGCGKADVSAGKSKNLAASDIAPGSVILPVAMPVPGRVLYEIVPEQDFVDGIQQYGAPVRFREAGGPAKMTWPKMTVDDVSKWSKWTQDKLKRDHGGDGGSGGVQVQPATNNDISGHPSPPPPSSPPPPEQVQTPGGRGNLLADAAQLSLDWQRLLMEDRIEAANFVLAPLREHGMIWWPAERITKPTASFEDFIYFLSHHNRTDQEWVADQIRRRAWDGPGFADLTKQTNQLQQDVQSSRPWSNVRKNGGGTDPRAHVRWDDVMHKPVIVGLSSKQGENVGDQESTTEPLGSGGVATAHAPPPFQPHHRPSPPPPPSPYPETTYPSPAPSTSTGVLTSSSSPPSTSSSIFLPPAPPPSPAGGIPTYGILPPGGPPPTLPPEERTRPGAVRPQTPPEPDPEVGGWFLGGREEEEEEEEL